MIPVHWMISRIKWCRTTSIFITEIYEMIETEKLTEAENYVYV